MLESAVATAFLIGLLSALSLPLGTLTSFVWRPQDRVVAGMMAFGGGALLAALTIDLVASALEQGHFNSLAVGCVLGGLLFIGLNQLINDYGGFLRKASTTIYHLRRKDHLRIKRILSRLGRIDIFRELPDREFRMLASSVETRHCPAGSFVYRLGDPADALFVVAEGRVDLLDPLLDMQPAETLEKNDAFGRTALFSGSPHALAAVAREDSTLWVVPKSSLCQLLENSPIFQQVLHRWLRQPEVAEYLRDRHGFVGQDLDRWMDHAAASLIQHARIPESVPLERNKERFQALAEGLRRIPWLSHLSPREASALSGHLAYRQFRRGETLFHQGDPADRMFILDHGQVSLIDSRRKARLPLQLQGGDGFGSMAFVAGCPYSVSAIATINSGAWVLRREDLKHLLGHSPEFRRRLDAVLEDPLFARYLEKKHGVSEEKLQRWRRRSSKSLEQGDLPPSILASANTKEHEGAPAAIWLGIMLDGIPESLVIGASMIHTGISLSLVAGLFLSNYPESLSSSVGMRQQGLTRVRILLMWTSIMLMTGVGAAAGNRFMVAAPPGVFALLEGLAAGAMLTMIAQTMLPEAYIKGGSIIGFSTLMGFLCAIYFTTLH
jgi:CRP-like cAMP-binding protein